MVPSMDILCGDLSGSLCNARRGCELQYTCTGGMSVPVAFQPVLVFYLLSPPVFVFSCSEQIDSCLGSAGTPKNTDCADCGFRNSCNSGMYQKGCHFFAPEDKPKKKSFNLMRFFNKIFA